MRKEIKNKIQKVTDSMWEALDVDSTEYCTKFNVDEIKKYIHCKYKISSGFISNSYKIEIKGFTINIYPPANVKDDYVYVEILVMLGKNRLNEHFALFFTIDQLEIFLSKITL